MPGGAQWRIKRRVIRHYDRIAPFYNALYGCEQSLKIKKILDSLSFSPSEIILDVGCGTGLLFKHLANPVNAVVGIDISRRILKVAKKLAKGSAPNEVLLVRADADFLPFRSGIFDKIFAITLLQNMPDPSLTLNEMARVAKDDSVIIVTGLKKAFSMPLFLKVLRSAGLSFSLLDDEDRVKCYIAICSKASSKSIYEGKIEMIA